MWNHSECTWTIYISFLYFQCRLIWLVVCPSCSPERCGQLFPQQHGSVAERRWRGGCDDSSDPVFVRTSVDAYFPTLTRGDVPFLFLTSLIVMVFTAIAPPHQKYTLLWNKNLSALFPAFFHVASGCYTLNLWFVFFCGQIFCPKVFALIWTTDSTVARSEEDFHPHMKEFFFWNCVPSEGACATHVLFCRGYLCRNYRIRMPWLQTLCWPY